MRQVVAVIRADGPNYFETISGWGRRAADAECRTMGGSLSVSDLVLEYSRGTSDVFLFVQGKSGKKVLTRSNDSQKGSRTIRSTLLDNLGPATLEPLTVTRTIFSAGDWTMMASVVMNVLCAGQNRLDNDWREVTDCRNAIPSTILGLAPDMQKVQATRIPSPGDGLIGGADSRAANEGSSVTPRKALGIGPVMHYIPAGHLPTGRVICQV